MAEPNVTVNQQTTNVIVTTEQQTPQVVNGQVVVTDTSKPANISITTLGENNTNNTQQLNITNNSDVRLVNVVNSSPNQAVDTQNIVVSRGSDVSVISADKGGPPGPPPEVLPHESDPYKLYVGGVEFSLPPGPTGPQGDIGPVGPIGPTGDLNAILFGTGTLPLLTYNDSTDILKIVGSGSTSVYYDDTNKKITISSLGTLYNPGSGLSLSGTTFHNTGVLYFNNRTGAVSLLSADVTGALGYTPLPTGNYSVVGHTHTSSNITDFNSSVSGLLPVKNITGSGVVNVTSVSGIYNVSVTGVQPSGNYAISGHTHTSSNITDFNSSVSGLLPVKNINGSGYVVVSSNNEIYTIGVTGLQPSGSYANSIHTHNTSDITNFASGVSGLVSGIYAPLNNPSLTGIPTAPTATSGTNSNQIATTQFVRTEVSNLVSSAPSTLDTLNELASALGNDPNFATTITNNLASKASISGVTFTGSVIIPSGTGNFNTLTVNNTGVSLNGHTHTTLQITNFNSGVSGLLPSVTGSGYVVSNFNNNIYTFNVTGLQPSGNYQIAFNNAVSGVGTSGYLTKWISNTAISSGLIYDNGTNIGIGITTPTGQLHVIGTGIFSNRIAIGTSGTASTEALIVGGNTAIGYPNENIDRTLTIHSSNASNKAMVLKNTNGSSYISYAVGNQNLYIGDASLRWFNVEYHAYGGGFHKFFGTNVTSPDMFINTSNGYVGIGSGLTASAQLHVSGSGIITDGLFLNDQTASTLTSFDTNKRLVSLSTALYPSLTEIAYIKGVTSSIQTQINDKQPSGNYAASSHTHTSSNITDFNSSVSGLVSGIYQSLLINPVTGVGTSGYLSKWTGSNSVSSGIIFDNGTNVGINTVNPSGKFHIESSVANNSYILLSSPSNVIRTHIGVGNSDSVPFLASTNNIQLASGNVGWGFFDRGTEGNLHIQRRGGGTSWSSVIMMGRSNGNVGIGTGVQATTPPEKLTVDGNIRVSDTTATQGNVVQFLRGGGGQYDYSIGKYGSIALAISLANDASSQRALQVGHHNGATFNPKFHVNGYTGAVGINTTTPSGYLDVAGDIYVRGTGNNLGTIYFKSQVSGDNTLYAGATNGGDLVLNGGGASLQLSSQGGYANLFALSTQLHIGHGYDAGNAFQTIRFVPAAKEMMRMTTSGTLGIGLPTSSSSYAGNSVQLFNQQPHANTRVHIAGSGSDSGSAALIVTNSSISPLLYVRNDGSVGIGTSSPSSQLHVVGSALFASGLNISNQTASTIASFDANKNIVSLSTGTYPSLIELSYVKDVTSSIQTQINSKQNTLINPVTGSGTNGKLSKWSSTSTLTDSILSESSTVINIAGSFNSIIDDTYLSFDANARRIGITKKGGFTGKFTYGSGSSFAIAQSSSGTIEAANTFTDRFVIDSNGNVGIGITNPAEKLDVSGNIKVAGANTSLTIAQDDTTTMRMRSAGNLIVAAGSAANVRFLISTTEHARLSDQGRFGIGLAAPSGKLGVAGGVTVGTNYNVTPPTNGMIVEGNVGIGMNNPSERIHVSGAQTTIRLNNSLSYDTQLRLTDTASDWSVGINQGNTLGSGVFSIRSVTAGASRLVINTSGNVGIGTATPSDKLNVIGNISAGTISNTKGNFIAYGSAGQPNILFEGFGSDGTARISTNSDSNRQLKIENDGASTTLGVYIEGDVGIGTTTPTYKLQVNGSFAASTKSFRINHPSKKDHSLEYGSLESPYHGVRLTGRGTVIKGVGTVSLPPYLKDLIHDDDTLNVQITNIKHGKTIYLEEIDLKNDRFIVKVDRAKSLGELQFCWTLTGVRKDVDRLVVEKRN